jgi:hypothetical protein
VSLPSSVHLLRKREAASTNAALREDIMLDPPVDDRQPAVRGARAPKRACYRRLETVLGKLLERVGSCACVSLHVLTLRRR